MRSFKTRIILWTLSISTFVLVAFGIAIDRTYYRLQLSHVDAGLRELAPRSIHPPEHGRFWDHYGKAVQQGANKILNTEILILAYTNKSKDLRVVGELLDRNILAILPNPIGKLREPERVELSDVELPGRSGRGLGPRFERGPKVRGEFLFVDAEDGEWRFSLYRGNGYNVAIGVSLADTMGNLSQLRQSYLLALPLALGVLGLGAWFFARKAIEPIAKLTAVAGNVSSADLSVRIEQASEDREFAELIDVFNGMLDRLERSFAQAGRFSADAAHELKTPLAILQGHLENAIQSVPDGGEVQQMLGGLVEETHRLKSIARKLLVLAQADTGKLPLNLKKTRLLDLVSEAVEDFKEEGDVAWVRREDVVVMCDQSLVSQIFQNLLSNAFKYRKCSSSRISVRLFLEAGECVFEIENDCEAIDGESRSTLFDRFTRIDSARNRSVEGTGLGLSLSREFARAHGGDLSVLPAGDFEKIAFRLNLPLSMG